EHRLPRGGVDSGGPFGAAGGDGDLVGGPSGSAEAAQQCLSHRARAEDGHGGPVLGLFEHGTSIWRGRKPPDQEGVSWRISASRARSISMTVITARSL